MNDLPNHGQAEYWTGAGGLNWVRSHAAYDAELASFGDDVLAAARIEPTERVLDVGCGTGALTLQAASAAAPATTTGVDISATMLGGARDRAQALGVTNVRFVEADMQTATFEGEWFDVVISRFGVMFFADPTAAFTNIAELTRSGGRLAFVCWQGPDLNLWMGESMAVVAPFIPVPPPVEPGAPGPMAFADGDRLRTILGDAGWVDLELVEQRRPLHLAGPGSVDHTVDFWTSRPNIAGPLADAAPEVGDQVRGALRDLFEPRHDGIGVAFDSGTWLVTARRP